MTQEFERWMEEETQFCYYDSQETIIHLPTRKLYRFDEVYQKFLIATGREKTDFQKKMLNDLNKAIAV